MDLCTLWRQFAILTWKNNLLRWRTLRTWLVEIFIPVLLTVGMLGIYSTIKPVEVQRNVPGIGYPASFPQWKKLYGKPICGWWSTDTLLWRCNAAKKCTDADVCSMLTFAVAPHSAADSAASAAATAFYSKVVEAANSSFPVKAFTSEVALEDYIGQKSYATGDPSVPPIGVAVVFETGAPTWKYRIRANRTTNSGFNYLLPPTYITTDSLLRNAWSFPENCNGRCWSTYLQMLWTSGFLAVQNLVDTFIVSQSAGTDVTLEANMVDFPAPSYTSVGFWGTVANFYGIFMVIAILYPISNVIRGLVTEKELKIREGMRMMAMSDSAHFLSWAFHSGTTFTIIAVLIVLVAGPLFTYSSRGLIFIYYLLFFYSTNLFSFWMSTFFSRSKTAAILGVLPYFGGYFITLGLKRDTPRMLKMLAALHPSCAFTLGMSAFTEYEDAGIGVTQYTWTTSASSNFSFADCLLMLFIDIFIYGFLYWYTDKVWPSEFGTRLPPWFCVTMDYWKTLLPGLCHPRPPALADDDVEAVLAAEQGPDVERVSPALAQQIREGKCVLIRGLHKSFMTNTGIKHAVDDLNLTMYSGQITALLGHNGAGKSTTIGMLTGLTPPSSGRALIDNKDISHDMPQIRKSLGVCPQHDVLFLDLTVEEHLILFARFKGVPNSKLKDAVEDMIREVGLTEKRKVAAKNLSGGMKRKLSVGIAFIGDSKVVFLDEPTSGMDPYSRRFTWNVIRKYREGRVIVLTTHFMDEADLLCDRIAIMAKGKLRACGSSLFLKHHFGVGYSLTMEKKPNADSNTIIRFVRGTIPQAKLLTDVGAEVSFQLPMDASSSFKGLFEQLDDQLEQLHVETYGMSVTTLEEVFVKIVRGEETDRAVVLERRNTLEMERRNSLERRQSLEASKRAVGEPGTTAGGHIEEEDEKQQHGLDVDVQDGWRFFRNHMRALLIKRKLYFMRDRKAWGYQFLLPALFVLIGCLLLQSGKNSIFAEKQAPLTFGLSKYNPGINSNANPLPYSGQGYFSWSNMEGLDNNFQWDYNQNVTGQQAIIDRISDTRTLPTYQLRAANSVYNMSRDLLFTRNDWKASRYGALSFNNISREVHYYHYNVHVNFTGSHASAVFANLISGALARLYDPSVTITTVLHPLPVTAKELTTASSFDGFPVVVMILLAFSFIPAAFVLFVVRERETKAKHLQIVSGVSFLSYWLSTWIFDFLSYQIPLWLTIIIIRGFDAKALVGGEALGATIVLLQLFGASVTGFSYLTSSLFKTPAQAQAATILLNFVCGLILVIVIIIMSFISTTRSVARKIVYALRVLPPFALGNGLINVVFVDFFGQLDGKKYTVWSWSITGYSIAYMAVETVVFFLLTLLLEYLSRRRTIANLIARPGSLPPVSLADKDDDVIKEEQRVNESGCDDVVVLKDMKKIYPGGKVAVRGISLGIPNGECFGLLGINGAGKTTTLSILTAEFPPSDGEVRLGGYDISQNPDVVRRLVGYCPQFDALFDLLTGREHLELYARVKGLNEQQVKAVVDRKIKEMDLVEYANRNASTYSGGNKRKLSVAMGLIGKPLIVFLDEPSTGMDPVARRFMWQVISDITTKRGECCIILTTHSMEECEALCTRIGIMVGGRLRCLGSAQRLKSQFGMGFQLELTVTLPSLQDIDLLVQTLPSAKATDGSSTGKITQAELPSVMEALGRPDWLARVSSSGSGADIWQSLQGGGSIGLRELAAWAKQEAKVDIVVSFIEAKFGGAALRERQGAKLRYEVPFKDAHSGKQWRLSEMFGIIEDNKTRLSIEDYSISQTSLEQIFNSFAQTQQEEQGQVSGIVHAGGAAGSTAPPGDEGGHVSVVPVAASTYSSPTSYRSAV